MYIYHVAKPQVLLGFVIAMLLVLVQNSRVSAATIVTNTTTAQPGNTIQLSGDCALPRFGFSVYLNAISDEVSTEIYSGTTDSAGAWSTSYTVPSDLATGNYILRVVCQSEDDDETLLAILPADTAPQVVVPTPASVVEQTPVLLPAPISSGK